MIMANFKDFPRIGRIMAVDWGLRRTGIAVSDDTRDFVFVRSPIVAGPGADVARQIVDLAVVERVVGIVVGLPLRTDGSESETTKMVREFARCVADYTDLPICFIDESLTSATAAEQIALRTMRDVKEKLDSESARIILENAIAVIKRL